MQNEKTGWIRPLAMRTADGPYGLLWKDARFKSRQFFFGNEQFGLLYFAGGSSLVWWRLECSSHGLVNKRVTLILHHG
jgi:hypothetical protein